MTQRPSLEVAVVMRRERLDNRWQPWRWSLHEVVPNEPAFGAEPRRIYSDEREERWLHPGLVVELFRDEAEGYHLNLASGNPVWFVMWRLVEDDPSQARPELVTLSYNEAGRLLDAQERVDNLPLQADVLQWLGEYAAEHYKPEPKQRRRPASFVAPDQRAAKP